MRTPIDLSLRRIGEGLQKDGEDMVQTPMPWTFLDLLCALDEKEEAAEGKPADTAGEQICKGADKKDNDS